MISYAETAQKALRPENIIKICAALEVSADYLLTGNIVDQDLVIIDKIITDLSPEQLIHLKSIIEHFLAVCNFDTEQI